MNRTRIFICLLLVFISSCVWYAVRELPWNHKYAETPAPAIFNEVMGMPVPKGVTNLKVAPRHFVMKRWAWLRFSANPTALNSILSDAVRIHDKNTIQIALKGTAFVPQSRFTAQDLQKVGWSDVYSNTDPEVYEFYGGISPGVWMGYVIVDRKTGTIFVSAGGD